MSQPSRASSSAGRLVFIPGVRHMPNLDQPTELARVIRAAAGD